MIFPQRKRSIRGSAIIESTLAMFVIFLVLGGLLQLFYFAVGQMVTDYAALRGIRSYIVGFRDSLVMRAAKVSAIGASGNIVEPEVTIYRTGNNRPDYKAKFRSEKSFVNTYLVGWRYLEYEFWNGHEGNSNSADYELSPGVDTHLSSRVEDFGKVSTFFLTFRKYALLLLQGNDYGKTRIQSRNILGGSSGPEEGDIRTNASGKGLTNMFFGDLDLSGKAAMRNHANVFLDTGGNNP